MSFSKGYGETFEKLLSYTKGCPQCKAVKIATRFSPKTEYDRGKKTACLEISKMSHECDHAHARRQ